MKQIPSPKSPSKCQALGECSLTHMDKDGAETNVQKTEFGFLVPSYKYKWENNNFPLVITFQSPHLKSYCIN